MYMTIHVLTMQVGHLQLFRRSVYYRLVLKLSAILRFVMLPVWILIQFLI